MKLFPVIAEHFMMDGGACFGVVPKSVWQKLIPANENNMIKLSSRCVLADTGSRLVLFDTGMGNKQSDKFFSYFFRFGSENLQNSFERLGYSFDQVTDVVLTHLHFDHVGGALNKGKNGEGFEPVFANATYYVSKAQWDWALDPNPREKASFLPENYLPLFESGRLEFIHGPGEFLPGIELELKNGHTRGLIVPAFDYKGQKVVFATDFIAMVHHIPLAYVPGFDIEPLESMKEKNEFLERAVDNGYVLFFQHDYYNECCTLKRTTRGVGLNDIFKISDL